MKQKSLCCVIALLLCFSCLATGCSHDKNKGGNTSSGSSSNSVSSENNSSSDSSGDSSQPQEESKPSSENTTSVPNGSSSTGGSTDKNVQINYTPIDDVNIVVPNGAKSTQKWTAADIVLNAKKTYGNPYTEQAINCQFTRPAGTKNDRSRLLGRRAEVGNQICASCCRQMDIYRFGCRYFRCRSA